VALSEMEKRLIQKGLDLHGHSLKGKRLIARALGISLSTLYNKMKRYGLEDHD